MGTNTVDELVEIVRRDIRRHTDSNSRGAVHQKIWQSGRKHVRFGCAFLVVGYEIDGIFVEVAQEVFSYIRQARFGVTIGCGRVAVDGTEVALRID